MNENRNTNFLEVKEYYKRFIFAKYLNFIKKKRNVISYGFRLLGCPRLRMHSTKRLY